MRTAKFAGTTWWQSWKSVKQQTYRPAEIVLVIDHNPTLQRRSANELPGVTVVPNDNEKGLPGARNAGVAAASPEIVAFVDDDAVAERNWLAALVAPYADPHVLGVGGQVVPVWQTGRPNWFPPEFDWVVGCSYRGMPAERTQVRNFSGASMSLRRRLLVESGGFDAGLSRIGTRSLACEETEICARLQRRHLDGVYLYEPKALVRRHVPCSRTTWSYYRSRCYAEGLSKAVVRDLAGPEWTMSSEKSFLRSIIPRAIGRNLVKALRGQPSGIAGVMALTGGVLINGIGYSVGRIRLPGNTTIHAGALADNDRTGGDRMMTTIPILRYHSVSTDPAPWIAPYAVAPATFARHVDLITASGRTAMTVSELCAALTGRTPLPHRPIVITFDDGFADFTYAARVLSEHYLPSTVYLTTGALRGRGPRPTNMAMPPAPMLDWSQLAELCELNVEIGAHSHTHRQLDTLPPSAIADEILQSKEMLEDALGLEVPSFAYPFGFHCEKTRRVVQSLGCSSACAGMNAFSSSLDCVFSLARLTIRATTTTDELEAWLGGQGARVAPYPETLRTTAWRLYRRARRGRAALGTVNMQPNAQVVRAS